MRAPRFWLRDPSLAATLLAPAASLWGRVAAQRMRRPRPAPPAPLFCVGNFTAGGAGKTPTVALVCELLHRQGVTPAVLSRGYGGSLSTKRPLRVDPAIHSAAEVGDEPLLLARAAPTIIGSDRLACGALAVRDGAHALVMDDGFQSASMTMQALVVVDGATGLGNGRVLPAGPLRAPMDAQWDFASATLVLGEGAPGGALAEEARRRRVPVFLGRLTPDRAAAETLAKRRVFAFAGIGRPEKFYASLEELGARIVARRSFRDHHPYVEADLSRLLDDARKTGADCLATTEKDMARLEAIRPRPSGLDAVRVLPVRVSLQDEDGFVSWLSLALRA